MIWGYPFFWKHPCNHVLFTFFERNGLIGGHHDFSHTLVWPIGRESMVVSGSRKRWDRWHSPSPNWQEKYHLYTTYILPSEGLYATYHLLGEPETTIEGRETNTMKSRIHVFLFLTWAGRHSFPATASNPDRCTIKAMLALSLSSYLSSPLAKKQIELCLK